MRRCLTLVAVLCAAMTGQELIQNGGFESGLAGWTIDYSNPDTSGLWEVSTATVHDPDPDRELYVYKFNREHASVVQAVAIPSTSVQFSANAKLYAAELTGFGWWAYAAMVVEYRNSSNVPLGRTYIVNKTPWCTLVNTPTQHLVVVTDTLWHTYSFTVSSELANLTGVNPAEVARVAVIPLALSTGQEC